MTGCITPEPKIARNVRALRVVRDQLVLVAHAPHGPNRPGHARDVVGVPLNGPSDLRAEFLAEDPDHAVADDRRERPRRLVTYREGLP